jgi:primosomal protein N' (replication factor Y)
LLINPAFNQDFSLLDDREYLIAEALTLQTEISIEDVQAILETKSVVHVVKSMLEKGVILLQEALVERYKPQTVAYLSLNPIYHQPEQLQDLLTQLQKEKRNDKQLMALMAFIHLSKTKGVDEVRKKELLEKAETTDSSLKTLIKKGVFTEFQKSISRLDKGSSVHIPLDYDLSPNQETALTQIKQQFEQKTSGAAAWHYLERQNPIVHQTYPRGYCQ